SRGARGGIARGGRGPQHLPRGAALRSGAGACLQRAGAVRGSARFDARGGAAGGLIAMTAPEFSRPVRIDTLGELPRSMEIAAEVEERAALARRFGLLAIDRLEAGLSIARRGGEVLLHGTLPAGVVQARAASGAPVPASP